MRRPSEQDEQASTTSVDVSIVICTLDRHESLARALRSCFDQRCPDGVGFEIVLVDNSPDGNALRVVDGFRSDHSNLRYVHETRTNISHARNAGVAAAAGRFIAFMDDDMAAPADWLASALSVIEATEADVMIGRVEPEFESATGWVQKLEAPAEWFGRAIDVPEGGVLTNLKRTGTGNAMLRAATTIRDDHPFDPSFGRIGGEDTDFLQRLQRQGAKIIFSQQAWMTEFVPSSRSTPDYLALRRFRESQQFVRLVVKNKAQVKWLEAARHMATGAFQLGLASARYAGARLTGADLGLPRVAMAQALGKVLWTQSRQATEPYR